MSMEEQKAGAENRARAGIFAGNLLCIVFGSGLITVGCLSDWKVDTVFSTFSRSGLGFRNLTASDGILVLVFTVLATASLVAGGISRNKWVALAAVSFFVLLLLIATVELASFAGLAPIFSPGRGLYMVLGGSFAGFFCSLATYSITREL